MLHAQLEQENGSEVQAIWSVQLIQLEYDLTVLPTPPDRVVSIEHTRMSEEQSQRSGLRRFWLNAHQDWPPLGPEVEPQPPGSRTARCLSFIFVYRFCGYSHIGCSQEALLSR